MPITITLRPELTTEAQTELFNTGIISTMRQTNTKTELYEYINNELITRKYQLQTKKEKTIIKKFLMSTTGYKEEQIDSFIKIYKSGKKIKRKKRTEYYFEKKYKQEDIALLLELHDMSKGICGQVVQVLCHDMYILYGDPRYEKVSMISSSHFYRIKNTHFWKERSLVYEHTKANKVAIGERTRPQNEGKPGFLRIDTVHQGSTTKGDGLYHINVVDEVTQYEFNAAVPYINEFYMKPLLIKLIDLFPFKIMNFHSDNGSEYINVMVNELLTKLFIKQTKSRPRKSTDNGLIETKNAQVIRKFIPRGFISKDKAEIMNTFFFDTFHEFINFHRVSMYPTVTANSKGKKKVSYLECKTPYQKFISLPDYEQYLKPGITAEFLSTIFYKENHVQFLKGFGKKHEELLAKIY